MWGIIRIGIFSGSFLLGLMFSGSGQAGHANNDQTQPVVQNLELRCRENRIVIVRNHDRSSGSAKKEYFF